MQPSQIRTLVLKQLPLVVTDPGFRQIALNIVSDILHAFLPRASCEAIRDDAISEVMTNLIARLPDMSEAQLVELYDPSGSDQPIRRVLKAGVSNYAKDRYRRWCGKDESAGRSGARSRVADEDMETILGQLIDENDAYGAAADEGKIADLLEKRGLNPTEIKYLKAHAAGFGFTDLANHYGGNSDKYRKLIARAKKKAGLEDYL